MVEWIHCNNCFKQVGDPRKFALASCGHIYCKECLTKTPDECVICKTKVMCSYLSNRMPKEQQMFFTSPTEMIQRHTNELKQIIDFQNKHRLHLINHIKEKEKRILSEYNNLTQSLRQIECEFKELEENRNNLLNENAYLKQIIGNGRCIHCGSGLHKNKKLNTPSQTSSNDSRNSFQMDATPSPRISPGRISMTSAPSDGRISSTKTSSTDIHSRGISPSTRFPSLFPSIATPPYHNVISSKGMQYQAPYSQYNRTSTSQSRSVTPKKLITIHSLQKK